MQLDKHVCAEAVAYLLMRDVALAEGRVFSITPPPSTSVADRKWILDTFAECLKAVWAPDDRLRSSKTLTTPS